MRRRQIDLQYLIRTLEIKELWNFNGILKNQVAINNRLADIKVEVKKHFKKLARIHHPDRGGDIEKFKELSSAHDEFQKIRLVAQQPRPQNRVIIINMGGGHRFSSSTSSTSETRTTGGWYKI